MTELSDMFDFRPAALSDFSQLADLYRQLIPNDLPASDDLQLQTFRTMLGHPGLTILLACTKDRAVATCTLVVVPSLTRGCASYALIENVVTHKEYRGQGIGEKLMHDASDRAWQAGCYKIMLMSGSKNTEAHRFYERIGFTSTKVGFELRAPGYPSREILR